MAIEDYRRYIYSLDVHSDKKVKEIDFNIKGTDFTGELNVTDIQLQSGSQVTAPVPNTSEMLEQVEFTVDERDFINTVSNPVKEGVQPTVYENITNRMFNIVGRGAEVIALPNVIHEDYTQDLVSSALDIYLTAKDDFDLVRVSTNDGALIPGRMYGGSDYPTLDDHALNYKYTREFYFEGGKAGDTLTLKASAFTAQLNEQRLPLAQGDLDMNGHVIERARQRFMLAPYGTFRIRIEFFKEVTETVYWQEETGLQEQEVTYLKDNGVGFYGYAEFNQYKGGAKY